MIVVVLSACPSGLRGDLTRWLLEVSPGTFVGNVSARVRDALWSRVCAYSGTGRALMVYNSDNEQRLKFKVNNHEWDPVDFEGVTLMVRPTAPSKSGQRRTGWSNSRNQVRSRRPSWRDKL